MKKIIKNTILGLVTMLVVCNAIIGNVVAIDVSSIEDGVYSINFTHTFTNPYDGNKVDGTPPSDMAVGAGTNIMNKVMGSEVTFEKEGDAIYVTLLLATTLTMGEMPLENLVIYVEESTGSNTYVEVAYTQGEAVIVEDMVYQKCRFKVASLDLIISPRYTMMSPSGYFIVLDGTEIEVLEIAANKIALSNKIEEAKSITSDDVTATSYATLQLAIIHAEIAYNNPVATQEEVDTQVLLLTTALAAIEYEEVAMADGIYEVPVALWHTTADRVSMVGESLVDVARVVVKEGIETVYIYTQEGNMGLIPGFQLIKADGTYEDVNVETTNNEGAATSFSFLLEEHLQYVPVKVITDIGTKQGMEARLKFDFSKLTRVADDTDINTVKTTNSKSNEAKDTVVKTGDTVSITQTMITTLVSITIAIFIKRKRMTSDETTM